SGVCAVQAASAARYAPGSTASKPERLLRASSPPGIAATSVTSSTSPALSSPPFVRISTLPLIVIAPSLPIATNADGESTGVDIDGIAGTELDGATDRDARHARDRDP